MNAKDQHKIDELILQLADETISQEDFEWLQNKLKTDAEALNQYVEQIANQSLLRMEQAEESELPGIIIQKPEQKKRSFFPLAISIAAASIVLIVLIIFSERPRHTSTDGIARIIKVNEAVGVNGNIWQENSFLSEEIIELKSGQAEIQTKLGVTLVLDAPAKLQIDKKDPLKSFLYKGQVVARVPPNAIGFTIETPTAKVVDLGTEFGVSADDETGTAIQVYEGEVITSTKDGKSQERLIVGQAVRIGKEINAKPEELPFQPNRFIRYLPDPWSKDKKHRKVTPYNKAIYDSVHIVPAPKGVSIDGNLDDWDLSGQFSTNCEPPYSDFYHVKAAMMYDENYLYVSAIVGDPYPMRSIITNQEEKQLYGKGGCITLRLSMDRLMGWPALGEGSGTRKRRELEPKDLNEKLIFAHFWHYAPESKANFAVSYGMNQQTKTLEPKCFKGYFKKHPDSMGYTMEYAIPWNLLNCADDPPQPGDILACTWLVHWAGPEGKNWKGQLIDVINPAKTDIWNFQNASTWGKAVFHEKGNLPEGTVKALPPIEMNPK